jgi:hypothetical protein
LQEPYEKGDDAKELHRAGPEGGRHGRLTHNACPLTPTITHHVSCAVRGPGGTSIRDIMAGAGDGAAL